MLSGSPFSFSKSSGEWLWKRWPAALFSLVSSASPFELAALAPLVLGQDLGLGRREHAVEAAQHGHGQHDALVLRRAVRAAQQVGDLPDQVREVVVVRHRVRSCGGLGCGAASSGRLYLIVVVVPRYTSSPRSLSAVPAPPVLPPCPVG